MEAFVLYSSPDQSISPHKQSVRNRSSRSIPKKFPLPNLHAGLLQSPPPPFLSRSFPPPFSLQKQPPLLPLPVAKHQTNNHIRGNSCSPINRKNNSKRTREQPNTPKKKGDSPKRKNFSKSSKSLISSECLVISSVNRLGPEPEDIPKDVVSKVLSSSSAKEVDKFSASVVFTVSSPPPSSLPLPTFSLRPKLSCNAEAAEIDAGATDCLRRLLRLM